MDGAKWADVGAAAELAQRAVSAVRAGSTAIRVLIGDKVAGAGRVPRGGRTAHALAEPE